MPDIKAYLAPRSVAVIGASNDTEILRGRILKVMLCHAFAGPIYPVSRSSDEVMGLKAYRSVSDIPGPVDLAVLIIPAEFVPDTLRECGRKGVKAAQIITSGFAEESGEAGAQQQALIRDIAHEFDMAVCGPNSEGFTNTRALLAATFSPVMDHPEGPLVPDFRSDGFVSVVAQSGGIGYSFFDRGRPKELPFNYIITTGNEAALEEMDLVDYLIDSNETDVFMLFMEDVKTPAKLVAVAEKALRAGKPLIVAKIGKSGAGQRAAASHTAALAGAYAGYRALFERYGIIEGGNIEEMVDIAAGFSHWGKRLPRGKRIGISTGSGGGGGWMADTAELEGLEVPVLDDATRAKIDEFLPPYGTSQNPVDGTAQAVRRIGYARMASMVAESPMVDAVITITSARHGSSYRREEAVLKQFARDTEKPLAFCSYTNPQEGAMEFLNRCGIPLYTDMRNCARAFAAMADYRALRERFLTIPQIRTTADPLRVAVGKRLSAAGTILCEYQAKPLLADYGIGQTNGEQLANNATDAVAAAKSMGGPVALKVQSPEILHKTEAGAVALGLQDENEIRDSFDLLIQKATAYQADADIHGVLVQPMAKKGREVILGINRDPAFGPMLMVGFGGIYVEVTKDVVFSPVPISAIEAHALLDRLKGRALLNELRGEPAADVDALVEAMVALSRFAADFSDEIQEIDLNPVLVHPRGAGITLVDALIVKQS